MPSKKYTSKDFPKLLAHDYAMSEEGRCVADKVHDGILQMPALGVLPSKRTKIQTREGVIQRDLVEVNVGGLKSLADRLTGTVYRDGRCLTSNLRRIL